jgi:uncharacterized membrane protein (UPF0127 family)
MAQACARNQGAAPPPPAATETAGGLGLQPHVTFPDGTRIWVEIAADDPTREQGLMFRDRMAADRGMIFVFPAPGEYPFWMKNTLIPLDMIWIDDGKRIVAIAADVQPCKADPCPSVPPHAIARYVLETNAGVAAKHHLKVGDVLKIDGLENVTPR